MNLEPFCSDRIDTSYVTVENESVAFSDVIDVRVAIFSVDPRSIMHEPGMLLTDKSVKP
jgi:hypothetical protein